MVYLGVYDAIFYYLEETGIVDGVIKYSEEVLKPFLPKLNTDKFYNEFILEFALFNYMHNDKMLIEFLSEELYGKLDNSEKKEFDLINESERFNLKFQKKIGINELDTMGRELYEFYFVDADTSQTKIVVSSSQLDKLHPVINARLIHNPEHDEKYSIIGGIMDKKSYEALSELSFMKGMMASIEESKEMAQEILKFSKEHSLEDIEQYDNKRSNFIEQDRKIMKINRLFFEKFGIGFDDFLNNFFELSNSPAKFSGMAEYYLSIAEELNDAILDTNYIFDISTIPEHNSILGFLSFIKKDYQQMEESIIELQNKGKIEFENSMKNEIALSRENIIKNQKIFLKEKIAPLKLDGFESFFERISNYPPDQIKDFLAEIADYLNENLDLNKNLEKMDEEIEFFISVNETLLETAEDMPYLENVLEGQKNEAYNPKKFYEYIDTDDETYSLHIFLLAANYAKKKQLNEAYNLIKENKPIKTNSFIQMFFFGKMLNFFDDDKYKTYFNMAKSIDGARYQIELKKFLQEKEQKDKQNIL